MWCRTDWKRLQKSEGLRHITLEGLNGLGELTAVGLLAIAFKNVSVHLVGGALKAGRLVAFGMPLSSLLLLLSTLAVSATTVCPARSATRTIMAWGCRRILGETAEDGTPGGTRG
jgi:hypothetical protein